MRVTRSGMGFVICGLDSRFMVVGGSHLLDSTVLIAELQAT